MRVEVVQLEPKLAVARTYEVVRPTPTFARLSGVAALFAPTEPRVVTLKKGAGQWEELAEEESYVKIGDPVEQVIEVAEPLTTPGARDGDDQSDPGAST